MSGKAKQNAEPSSRKAPKGEAKKTWKQEREFHKASQRIMRKTVRSTHH